MPATDTATAASDCQKQSGSVAKSNGQNSPKLGLEVGFDAEAEQVGVSRQDLGRAIEANVQLVPQPPELRLQVIRHAQRQKPRRSTHILRMRTNTARQNTG